jgi:hypothetical protein
VRLPGLIRRQVGTTADALCQSNDGLLGIMLSTPFRRRVQIRNLAGYTWIEYGIRSLAPVGETTDSKEVMGCAYV